MYDNKFYNLNFAHLCEEDNNCSINFNEYSYKFDEQAYIRIAKSVKNIGINKCVELEVRNIEFNILIFQVDNQLSLFTSQDFRDCDKKNKVDTSDIENNLNYLYSKEELVENYFGKKYFSDINKFKKAIKYIQKFKEYLKSFNSINRKGSFKEFEIYYKERMIEDKIKEDLSEIKKSNNTSKSSVYIISDTTGRYKIGVSKNPNKRLLQLQTGNSNKLEISHVSYFIPNAYSIEKKLHNLYNEYRITNEWFSLKETQVNEIINKLESVKN